MNVASVSANRMRGERRRRDAIAMCLLTSASVQNSTRRMNCFESLMSEWWGHLMLQHEWDEGRGEYFAVEAFLCWVSLVGHSHQEKEKESGREVRIILLV